MRADDGEAVHGFTTEHIVQPGPLVWQALALAARSSMGEADDFMPSG